MNQILVSSEELQQSAALVNSTACRMQEIFTSMNSAIDSMHAIWDSPASSAAFARYESLKPVFNQYIGIVEAYYAFLKQTADAYDENEAMLRTMGGA